MENTIVKFFNNYGDILFIFLGLYSIGGAVFQWKWFVNNHRAKKVARISGGNIGMRIFYFVLGACFLILGVVSFLTDISVLYLIPMFKQSPLSVFDLL